MAVFKGYSSKTMFRVGDKVRISNITCPTVGQYHTDGDECVIVGIGGVNGYDAEFDTGRRWLIGEGVCDVELIENVASPSALDIQVGGNHYKILKIQPVEYIMANNIPYVEGSVIKYVTRWRNKNGLADLEKARHFLDILIEEEKRQQAGEDHCVV